jgi:hypothetical protein
MAEQRLAQISGLEFKIIRSSVPIIKIKFKLTDFDVTVARKPMSNDIQPDPDSLRNLAGIQLVEDILPRMKNLFNYQTFCRTLKIWSKSKPILFFSLSLIDRVYIP